MRNEINVETGTAMHKRKRGLNKCADNFSIGRKELPCMGVYLQVPGLCGKQIGLLKYA